LPTVDAPGTAGNWHGLLEAFSPMTSSTTSNTLQSRRYVDWDAVERDYRATQITLRELGAKHGRDHAAVARKAAKGDWKKDLTAAVGKATNAKLIEQAVAMAHGINANLLRRWVVEASGQALAPAKSATGTTDTAPCVRRPKGRRLAGGPTWTRN